MTANEKRAQEVLDRLGFYGDDDGVGVEAVRQEIDAAERRGEERVLRWMHKEGFDDADVIIRDYRKARRARVGRGRKCA